VALSQASAETALAEACAIAGLDATDAELIRLGENAVFRLRSEPVIIRIARDSSRLPDSEREIQVSHWLVSENFAAVRALNTRQPIMVNGHVATLWVSASERTEYGSARELGDLMRRLHGLTPPPTLHLPTVAPFERARHRIGRERALLADDRIFLRDRCEQLAAAYDRLSFELPSGVVHGDANVGNVIRDRHGRALLSDLDGFAVGPREWDLVLTAIYYERFGWHTEQEYRDFTDAYGYDVMISPAYPVLRDTRELLMVTWLAQNADANAGTAAELAKRVRALRQELSRRDWQPF
jgi:aminoglycoside phosphotransferase (APT) family kinase protein